MEYIDNPEKEWKCVDCGEDGEWGLYYNEFGDLLCPDCLYIRELKVECDHFM